MARKQNYRELVELKGKIRECKMSYRTLAPIAKMSLNSFNDKINGYGAFDIVEASNIANALGIPISEIRYYFA